MTQLFLKNLFIYILNKKRTNLKSFFIYIEISNQNINCDQIKKIQIGISIYYKYVDDMINKYAKILFSVIKLIKFFEKQKIQAKTFFFKLLYMI